MAPVLSVRNYNEKELIFREGESADYSYIIESGRVEICIIRGDQKKVLAVLEKGEIFGEMAIIDGTTRSATAICLEPCTLCVVSKEQLRDRVEKADPVVRMLLKVIMDRLRIELLSAENVLKQVNEQVLEFVKKHSENQVTSRDQTDALEKIRLESQLLGAVESNQFELHYQPIVEILTEDLVGYEALLRWNHPKLGSVRPDHFIALAEETDLIIPIGSWVIQQAALDLKLLKSHERFKETHPHLSYISVNISGRQLIYPKFFEELETSLKKASISASELNLEVTESTLVEYRDANTWIDECKKRGLTISLDDFGTGYSSLSYLNKMKNIDSIKLDREFVRNVLSDKRNLIIARSIINMARELDLKIIAEGIETKKQNRALNSLSCPFGQGYLYGKPRPLKDILADLPQKKEKKKAA